MPDISSMQITTAMLWPILTSVIDNFMFLAPALISVIALKLGAWLLPILLNQITKK